MVTHLTIGDATIRAVRDEARAVGDDERVRCCHAALGLPIGDGAGGNVDMRGARERIAAIVNNNLSCGLNTYGVPDSEGCSSCGAIHVDVDCFGKPIAAAPAFADDEIAERIAAWLDDKASDLADANHLLAERYGRLFAAAIRRGDWRR